MRNYWIKTIIGIGVLFGIEMLNDIVMLAIKPLNYWYTVQGVAIAACVCSVEILMMWPLLKRWINETTEIVNAKLNSK